MGKRINLISNITISITLFFSLGCAKKPYDRICGKSMEKIVGEKKDDQTKREDIILIFNSFYQEGKIRKQLRYEIREDLSVILYCELDENIEIYKSRIELKELEELFKEIRSPKIKKIEGYHSIDTIIDPEFETLEIRKNRTIKDSIDFNLFFINHEKPREAEVLFYHIYEMIESKDWLGS